ncbi:MAG: 3-hydroxyacyl-CoA dehydrogenase NAD-binding domain-containing protein [Zhengella sp.]|uniref:3-hydroxyacyl-CoA dehydrogenase NAD-binding domain-containing protein n=1 Tax=Zhengella sp. TaxID=2282762 RepID=UPI00352828BC|nr:carnitine 3-dehydrogenase [Brucellaceae bacterium]
MTGKAAIVGGGVIGGGWAARFLLNGWDVAVFDPDPQAERKIGAVMAHARASLPALYDSALPREGRLSFHSALAAAVEGADWVQESVPERLDLKHRILAEIKAHCPPGAITGSSTSGFKPSELNARGARAIVAHPFNPVYLLPLVELVGEAGQTGRAAEVLRSIGMFPLVINREIDAHIADRLLEAVWRESLWLVKDGIATTGEIDEAIRMGFGLRWAQMGLFETYRIAGGEAGMKHFMAQFGPALSWPWTRLTDVPEFNDALVDLIAEQSDAQSGHMEIRDLERLRDDNLVAILRALKRTGSGAGGVIRQHEAGLAETARGGATPMLERQVPASWTGEDGVMREIHFMEAGMAASRAYIDRLAKAAGCARDEVRFVVSECRIRLLGTAHAADRLRMETRLVESAPDSVCLEIEITRGDGAALAAVETILCHVDGEGAASPWPFALGAAADLASSVGP